MRRRLFGAGRNSSSKLRGEVFEESANSRLEIFGSGATFVHLILCNIAVAVANPWAIEWRGFFGFMVRGQSPAGSWFNFRGARASPSTLPQYASGAPRLHNDRVPLGTPVQWSSTWAT